LGPLTVSRLAAHEAIGAIEAHQDVHPGIHKLFAATTAALGDPGLQPSGLLAMDPCRRDKEGALQDVVQAAVTKDLGDIMNSYIPKDVWEKLFPNTSQATLTGTLAEVAASPVEGVTDPLEWYRSLAAAVLSSGLASGSDPNCQYLNGPRAVHWLKTEVATSKVYHAHGQKLFHTHWQQEFPLTAEYLADQNTNAARLGEVDAKIAEQLRDIEKNVVADPKDPDLKEKLKKELTQVGEYAKTNKLYWAFLYYVYNTNPTTLANVGLQMQLGPGADGTALSRLFQKNVAVLTALDPSNFFAQQYIATLNIYLVTNILPSMFDFPDDPAGFELIKEYLQQFLQTGLNNEDNQIKDAAKQLAAILAEENFDRILHDSINALRTFAGAIDDLLALPYVAQRFVSWFEVSYPSLASYSNVFGSTLIGGLTMLAVFNVISDFKSYGKLTRAERGQLITNALQVGIQIFGAVVKRGVRIWAIWGLEGLSNAERAAGIGKILFTSETDLLDLGLMNIGSTMARWLGDTEGSIGKLITAEGFLVVSETAVAGERVAVMTAIFGKNLDAFIATRVGPLFILAGIGWSLYRIIEGEGTLALAGDILSIVSGGLMLFAMFGLAFGEWLIAGALSLGFLEAGGAVATFLSSLLVEVVSCAGPLGILLALAGVGVMLYELFKQPPDPVEEFVRDHAKKAGFWVPSKAASLDYAVPYTDADQAKLLIIGFTLLSAKDQALICAPDGSISTSSVTKLPALPNRVWRVATDGQGMS
jgi:hypothetical protein